jgi:hypothetical protein
MAKPNPLENRAPWYKNTAPTYAGIFLWFVFWQDAASGVSVRFQEAFFLKDWVWHFLG